MTRVKAIFVYIAFLCGIFMGGMEVSAAARVDYSGMVKIPAGEFSMVLEKDGQRYVRKVYLDDFYIDRFEVNTKDYLRCVLEGKCSVHPLVRTILSLYTKEIIPPGSEREKRYRELTGQGGFMHGNVWAVLSKYSEYREFFFLAAGKAFDETGPIGFLSGAEAAEYCHSYSKRLPTNAEWEKAARGDKDERMYTWGNEPPVDCSRANLSGLFDPVPEGCPSKAVSYQEKRYSASPFGVYNMIGNQSEYILDSYEPTYFDHMAYSNPLNIPKAFPKADMRRLKVFTYLAKGVGYKAVRNMSRLPDGPPLPPYTPGAIGDIHTVLNPTPDSGVRCVASPDSTDFNQGRVQTWP